MEAAVNPCVCLEYGVGMQAQGITQQCRRIIIFGVHDKNWSSFVDVF